MWNKLLNNFITDGMLECEDCYKTFDKQIDKVLKKHTQQ